VQPAHRCSRSAVRNSFEVVVDLLSADAVRVEPGRTRDHRGWGGELPLAGRVRRVEPFGFTKVSALGIEEQRVNVVIDITEPRERWLRLGHGYRVEPRIVLWERATCLRVPLSALFRQGDKWRCSSSRRPRRAARGRDRPGQWPRGEVRSGLEAGERVVLHPGDRVPPAPARRARLIAQRLVARPWAFV